ncbi:MAG: ribosome biosis GTPase YlqF [Pseudomonadota bacterium]
MAIQWFPGHMHATRKAILARMKDGIDVVIELLDARAPGSSSNPLLARLTQGRPALKVLNKQDLADPARTERWLDTFNARPGTRAIALDAGETAPAQRLIAACRALAPGRNGLDRPMRVLICGIPNVGKSTLINSLAGKRAARTGDEPGITKNEQRIALTSDFYLYDTPGMLWPKIIVEQSGHHLAAIGSIGRNAMTEELVAAELIGVLRRDYPGALEARYRLDPLPGADQLHDDECLEQIGRRRGAVLAGGRIHLQKAAELVLHDFRSGTLGRITLETPEAFAVWLAEAEAAEEALQAEREAARPARRPRAAPRG